MEELRNWAMTFCIASVTSAFISLILPKGEIKKSVNTVITLFMLAVTLIPLGSFSLRGFTDYEPEAYIDDYSYEMNKYLLESGREIVKENAETILKEICTREFRVGVEMIINDDGNPELTKIAIEISRADSASTVIIKSKIGSLTGVVPEVKINDEF